MRDWKKEMTKMEFRDRRRSFGKLVCLGVAGALALSLTPAAGLATVAADTALIAYAAESDAIVLLPGSSITASGTYMLDAYSDDAYAINGDNLNVVIDGTSGRTYNRLSFVVNGENVTVTFRNVNVSVEVDAGTIETNNDISVVDFGDHKGTFNIEGENCIEKTNKPNTKADPVHSVIHVGENGSVTFGGTGLLYGFKGSSTQSFIGGTSASGSGGGAPAEPNGEITFVSGTWLIKGSQAGAVIGSDGDKAGKPITVKGGDVVVITKAGGAALGGSNMGVAGDIVLEGGSLQAFTTAQGSAIGAGGDARNDASRVGRLIVKGGALRTGFGDNAFSSGFWPNELRTGEITYSDAAITAKMSDAAGNPLVTMDIVGLIGAFGDINIVVDGVTYYEGKLPAYTMSTLANGMDTKASFEPWDTSVLSFRVTPQDHAVSINGERFKAIWNAATQSFTLGEPDPELPATPTTPSAPAAPSSPTPGATTGSSAGSSSAATPAATPAATTKTGTQKLTVSNTAKTIYASSLSKGKLKKATSFTLKTAGNKGKITYKLSSASATAKKYITVSSAGKVAVKKNTPMGTYTLKVKASAAKASVKSGNVTTTYPTASKTVTVKVTVGAQTASVTTKATVKASTLKKNKVALSLKAKTTSGKITKVSNASTDKTAKKFTVKKASNSKITVTVPKGTKKGTYTLKVKVTAPKVAGKCLATTVTATVKVTVK